jgi:hypothetical protein
MLRLAEQLRRHAPGQFGTSDGSPMGMLREILTIALRALRSHKMRSMLTMLGLMIGVAAVRPRSPARRRTTSSSPAASRRATELASYQGD